MLQDECLFRKEKTNTKITIDAEKSTTNAPVVMFVKWPYTTSKEDEPWKKRKNDNISTARK